MYNAITRWGTPTELTACIITISCFFPSQDSRIWTVSCTEVLWTAFLCLQSCEWFIYYIDLVFFSTSLPYFLLQACWWVADREVQVQWSRKPTWRKVFLWCKVEHNVSNFRACCLNWELTPIQWEKWIILAVARNWIQGPWLVLWLSRHKPVFRPVTFDFVVVFFVVFVCLFVCLFVCFVFFCFISLI